MEETYPAFCCSSDRAIVLDIFFFFFFFARLFKTDTSIFGTEVILGVKDIGDKKRENE